jgi:hypothetical protein
MDDTLPNNKIEILSEQAAKRTGWGNTTPQTIFGYGYASGYETALYDMEKFLENNEKRSPELYMEIWAFITDMTKRGEI